MKLCKEARGSCAKKLGGEELGIRPRFLTEWVRGSEKVPIYFKHFFLLVFCNLIN